MRNLILIHGRSQQNKDCEALKVEWLDALQAGLAAAGVSLVIPDELVAFPYYGDTLAALTDDINAKAPDVVIAGPGDADAAERAFTGKVLLDMVQQAGISDEQIRVESGQVAIEAGPLNWPWVLAALRALEKIKGVGALNISLFTHDVWVYLKNLGVQRIIDNGVQEAFKPGQETVVVAHSLGTVVAYNLLARQAAAKGWSIPTLITVGCPLGIGTITDLLRPITHPDRVGEWYNAYDKDDTVALNPLDAQHFGIVPPVENYGGVDNPTSNQHGISGYLAIRPLLADLRCAALTHDACRCLPGVIEVAGGRDLVGSANGPGSR